MVDPFGGSGRKYITNSVNEIFGIEQRKLTSAIEVNASLPHHQESIATTANALAPARNPKEVAPAPIALLLFAPSHNLPARTRRIPPLNRFQTPQAHWKKKIRPRRGKSNGKKTTDISQLICLGKQLRLRLRLAVRLTHPFLIEGRRVCRCT